jgi:hypothetical protein
LSLRKKINIVILAVYWPLLFVLAHIPIPQVVYEAQVSDKSLHFLAYMILVFLLWSAFCPETRVTPRKKAFWWVIITVICYSAADEVLQSYVGRMCDFRDFLANLAGASTAMLLMSVCTFWPSLLVVTATAIFLLVNLARTNIADLMLHVSVAFYVLSYALFTTIWIAYLKRRNTTKLSRLRYSAIVAIVPLTLLTIVEAYSVMLGRYFGSLRLLASLAGICTVIMIYVIVKSLPMISNRKSLTTHS